MAWCLLLSNTSQVKKQTSRAKRAFWYHAGLRELDPDLLTCCCFFFVFFSHDDKMIRISYTAVLYLITLIASLSSVSRYWCAHNFLSQFPKKLAEENTREGLGKRRTPFFFPTNIDFFFNTLPLLFWFSLPLTCLFPFRSTSLTRRAELLIINLSKLNHKNVYPACWEISQQFSQFFFPEQWAVKISLLKVF